MSVTGLGATLEDLAIEACKAGTHALLSVASHPRTIETKGPRLNIVTDADRASEEAILRTIRAARPNDSIVSEESRAQSGTSGITWVIDPLDSTANFVRGIPLYSVSVAVRDEIGGIAAAVGDPSHGILYSTARGSGMVRRNGQAVSSIRTIIPEESLALLGIGPRTSDQHPRTAVVPAALLAAFGKVRSPGSPALGLAWVASGLADLGYYEMDFHEWDVAAGCLLCEESGLTVIRSDALDEGLSPRVLVGVPELVRAISPALGICY